MKHLIRPIIKHPYLTVGIILLITIILGYFSKNIKFDTDFMKMLPEDNPVRVAQEEMEEEFGVADMIVIGLVTDDIFNADFLEKVKNLNLREVAVFVRGVGSGREAAVRALINHGLEVVSIKDVTPVPHNGCRPPKPRRV